MSLLSSSEALRLDALIALDVLDTPQEQRFDRFTRLAAMSFGVPISLISLIDAERQWFKSRCGLDVEETARSLAFCAHAVAMGEMLIVEDALRDARFVQNQLVTGNPHIRFYAGQPIFSGGQAVGTLCIIDREPRVLSEEQQEALRDLATMVEAELNLAKLTTERLMAEQAIKALNADLEQRVQDRTKELESKVHELSLEISRRKAAEASFLEADAWNRSIIASSYSGFVGTDSEGYVIEWNASAERIFGWSQGQAIGRRISELIIPPEYREAHEEGMRRSVASGEATRLNKTLELRAQTATGQDITVEMTVSAYEWKGSRYFGAFLSDISERIQIQQQLEEKQELLDAILDSIDVGVVACDAVGNLTIFNRSARAMHGLGPSTISPSEWASHYSLYHSDGRTPMGMNELPLISALKGKSVKDRAMTIVPASQPPRTLLASGRPLRGASGRTLGAVAVLKDVSELNASRVRLEVSERRLRTITENLPAMIGKVDAAGKFVFLNSRAMHVYGKTSQDLIGHPIESVYSAEEFARMVPYVAKVKGGERVFFEEQTKVGEKVMHYQCVFIPQIDLDGKPDGFLAMAFDISARKFSELRQAESEERLRTITDNLPVLIAYLGSDRCYQFANAVHLSWLGINPEHMLGKTPEEVFSQAVNTAQADSLEQAWKGHASQCEHEISRRNHTRIVHTTFLPQIRDGMVSGVYVLTTDATVSRMHERNLHALAHTDSLTQLPNRRQFEVALEGACKRSRQTDRRFALLYLDVDYFKQINDRYGHAIGDAVLVEFAHRLRSAVRGSDLVTRLAGDEFTVLLTDIHAEPDVERIAEKILEAVRRPFIVGSYTLLVTTTIGGSLSDGNVVEPRQLMEVADAALYRAKEAGRNTYTVQVTRTMTG